MDGRKALLIGLTACIVALASVLAWAGPLQGFTPVAGMWRMDTMDGASVVVVDGNRRAGSGNGHFPIAVYEGTKDFRNGTITVQFKPLAGKSDQAGGIVFDRKDNGDYLVIRANALENNLNLYRYASGRRTSIKEVANAPAPAGVWHELKVVVSGSRIQGFLDGKPLLQYDLDRDVSGGVGLWSKDDSVAAFRNFQVSTEKQ